MNDAISLPIYLDYAATTPVDPRVAERMARYLTRDGGFGNPASVTHGFGRHAEEAVERARGQVARLVNCDPRRVIWTSGATESNNLAILGAARASRGQGRHIVTTAIEHRSVLDACRQLECEGFEVTFLTPRADGRVDAGQVAEAMRDDTRLVSVMHVNNEIGVIQDIAAIGQVVRDRGALFHVDAAQSAGKVPIDLERAAVDLMSLSAHKLYGPKGAGALYVAGRDGVVVEPLMFGGGHERGLRPGTLPTHQIVGMGEAFRIAGRQMNLENARIRRLRDRLWEGLRGLPGVCLNGGAEHRVAGNLNVSFAGVGSDALMMAVADVAVSSGSACSSASREPSYVLRALGTAEALAACSIRFSVGRYTTEAEVDYTVRAVREAVTRLRAGNPMWQGVSGVNGASA